MKNKNPDIITKNRIIIIGIFSLIIFLIITARISYLQLHNNKASVIELNKLSTKTVYGSSMPRGRIYDRNGNIIVDSHACHLLESVFKQATGHRYVFQYVGYNNLGIKIGMDEPECHQHLFIISGKHRRGQPLNHSERLEDYILSFV